MSFSEYIHKLLEIQRLLIPAPIQPAPGQPIALVNIIPRQSSLSDKQIRDQIYANAGLDYKPLTLTLTARSDRTLAEVIEAYTNSEDFDLKQERLVPPPAAPVIHPNSLAIVPDTSIAAYVFQDSSVSTKKKQTYSGQDRDSSTLPI